MPILKTKQVWKRPRSAKSTKVVNQLAPDEAKHVQAAMRALLKRHGTWTVVAQALGVTKRTMSRFASGEAPPNAGMGAPSMFPDIVDMGLSRMLGAQQLEDLLACYVKGGVSTLVAGLLKEQVSP